MSAVLNYEEIRLFQCVGAKLECGKNSTRVKGKESLNLSRYHFSACERDVSHNVLLTNQKHN